MFSIMDKLELNMHKRAMMASFCLKEFQRINIFCHVDSAVYHLTGNTLKVDSIDSRTANPPASWIRKLISKDGFDENFRMECDAGADDSTASAITDSIDNSNVQPPPSLNSTKQAPPAESLAASDTLEQSEPRQCSTPDQPVYSVCLGARNAEIKAKSAEVMEKLDQVHQLCNTTMAKVDALEEQWSAKENFFKDLKVILFFQILASDFRFFTHHNPKILRNSRTQTQVPMPKLMSSLNWLFVCPKRLHLWNLLQRQPVIMMHRCPSTMLSKLRNSKRKSKWLKLIFWSSRLSPNWTSTRITRSDGSKLNSRPIFKDRNLVVISKIPSIPNWQPFRSVFYPTFSQMFSCFHLLP